MFRFPYETASRKYSTVRFIGRMFGVEYTGYENRRIREVYNAKITKSNEVAGYVIWLNRNDSFLIVPTLTSHQPYIFCRIPDGTKIKIPSERAFITAKGKWSYDSRVSTTGVLSASQVFNINNYQESKPDIEEFKPDIKFHDFKGIIFDRYKNIDEHCIDMVAANLVSSPAMFDRVGGLTLSLYNESNKVGNAKNLISHIRRFLPEEIRRRQTSYKLQIEEIGRNVTLDPFPWIFKDYNADNDLSNEALRLLNRNIPSIPQMDSKISEVNISLYSQNSRPKTLRDLPVAMSDFPMLIADGIESRGGFYDASPEIIKFIIAANMVQTSTDITFYKEAIGTAQDEIDRLVYMHSAFEKEIGKGGILDKNIHGKPTSLFHLGLSNARASLETRMSKEALEKSLDLYRKTMRDILDAWNLARPEHGKWDYSGISLEQRKFAAYLREHGPCTPKELFNAFKDQMSQSNFDRLWQEMRDFGGVYEKYPGFFDVA